MKAIVQSVKFFISLIGLIARAVLVVAAMLVQFVVVIFATIFSLVVSLWIHRGDWLGNCEKDPK
jgi:hypothetical protein